MVQWLRALAALPGDESSWLRTYIRCATSPLALGVGNRKHFFFLCVCLVYRGNVHTCVIICSLYVLGLGGGPVDNHLLSKEEDKPLHKELGIMACVYIFNLWETGPGTYWPDNQLMKSGFNERPIQEIRWRTIDYDNLMSCLSSTHDCAPVYPHMWGHTLYTHKMKQYISVF